MLMCGDEQVAVVGPGATASAAALVTRTAGVPARLQQARAAMEKRRWERPRTRMTGVCPHLAQVRAVGGVMEKPASSLSRPGARCRDCSQSVSPDLSPNPPCPLLGNGLSTVSAVKWVQEPRVGGSCCRGSDTGSPRSR